MAFDTKKLKSTVISLVSGQTKKTYMISGVWYNRARFGTKVKKPFTKDILDYAETNPFWPYRD